MKPTLDDDLGRACWQWIKGVIAATEIHRATLEADRQRLAAMDVELRGHTVRCDELNFEIERCEPLTTDWR